MVWVQASLSTHRQGLHDMAACCDCYAAQDGPLACCEYPVQMSCAAWGRCTGLLLVALLVLFLLLTLVAPGSQPTEPAHTSCTLESGLHEASAGHCALCSSWDANDMRMLQDMSVCLRYSSLPEVNSTIGTLQKPRPCKAVCHTVCPGKHCRASTFRNKRDTLQAEAAAIMRSHL